MVVKSLRLVNNIPSLLSLFLDLVYVILDVEIFIFLTQLSKILEVGQKISDLLIVNFEVAHSNRILAVLLSLKHLKE